MVAKKKTAPRVEDIPCPKCGHDEVRINYQEGGSRYDSAHDRCRLNVGMAERGGDIYAEHFHRVCQRCHYVWATADVLTP